MERTATIATPYANLIVWLEDHEVPFEVHEHPLTFTAEAAAHADHVDTRTFAKVVGVRDAEGNRILVVIDSTDRVDLVRLAAHLGVDWVTLLSEDEVARILPECEVGTIPPIPEIALAPVYADEAVRSDEQISFHAGSHRHAVRVDRAAWERAAGIRYGTFARVRED